jgi:hypothetical protein
VKNFVSIQPSDNEGPVLASDATSRKTDASLVQVILEDFCFNVFSDSRKFVVLN